MFTGNRLTSEKLSARRGTLYIYIAYYKLRDGVVYVSYKILAIAVGCSVRL